MTAEEWDRTTDLEAMLDRAGEPLPARKLLLLNAAFARRVAGVMPDDSARGLIELTERRADGLVGDEEWAGTLGAVLDQYLGNEAARDGAGGATFGVLMRLYRTEPVETLRLAAAVVEARQYLAYHTGYPATLRPEEWVQMAARTEVTELAELCRCVIGNPYLPVAVRADWHTSTVVALARGVYEERAFDRLPILADALQDAGCENETILAHCRGAGPHARGCWVVDGLLGKE